MADQRHPLLAVLASVLALLAVVSCGGSPKISLTAEETRLFDARKAEADALFLRGSFASLSQALEIYEGLPDIPAYENARQTLFKTAVVLALRCRELGIVDPAYDRKARDLLARFPDLAGFIPYFRALVVIPHSSRGASMSDLDNTISLDKQYDWIHSNVGTLIKDFRDNAGRDEFYAVFYVSFARSFDLWIEDKDDFLWLRERFADSPLVRYTLAVGSEIDGEALARLLDSDPGFLECRYFLGEVELQKGLVLSAEKSYLSALESFPHSTAVLISLTKIYFYLEEFEKCLEINGMALERAPFYRDAIIGKVVCLGMMGRNEEALGECLRLLELGKYYIGEAYYWTAWNQAELGRWDPAWEAVETSRNYLIGHHEVSFLSGRIAFSRGDLLRAEKDFKETLELLPQSCEAAFNLGRLYGDQERWEESGVFFEKAALCQESQEEAVRLKIQEIEKSSLSYDRKNRQIQKKKAQLISVRLSKATAYFNGAVGCFNAGDTDKALSLAEKASEHPNFRERAEEMVHRIRGIRKG